MGHPFPSVPRVEAVDLIVGDGCPYKPGLGREHHERVDALCLGYNTLDPIVVVKDPPVLPRYEPLEEVVDEDQRALVEVPEGVDSACDARPSVHQHDVKHPLAAVVSLVVEPQSSRGHQGSERVWYMF